MRLAYAGGLVAMPADRHWLAWSPLGILAARKSCHSAAGRAVRYP